MKAILVTTKHRGVFFGYVDQGTNLADRTIGLINARMAIRWGTTLGIAQLAATGPTDKSKIGARADIPVLHDVTAMWAVTDKAREAWESVV